MMTSEHRRDGPAASAYQHLRQALVNNEFRPGERLLITSLASKYCVSTTPVREALNRLREESLIDFRPGHGFYCKMPEANELQDLFELLCVLMVYSIERIIAKKSSLNMEMEGVASLAEQAPRAGLVPPSECQRIAALVETAIEQVIVFGGNYAALQTGRNALMRTHFVRKVDFESPDSVRQASTTLTQFAEALQRYDQPTAEQMVRQETARTIDRLPSILREGLWRFYRQH